MGLPVRSIAAAAASPRRTYLGSAELGSMKAAAPSSWSSSTSAANAPLDMAPLWVCACASDVVSCVPVASGPVSGSCGYSRVCEVVVQAR